MGFLLRTMSVERCLDSDLTSVMVLSKGRSKAESNKERSEAWCGCRRLAP